jgi:hypothetical protein
VNLETKDADRDLSPAQIVRILGGARAEHTPAMKGRIDKVGLMNDVASFTKRVQRPKVRTPPLS